MFSSSKIFRLLASYTLVVVMSVAGLGDTVRLKDGSILKGKIIDFAGGKFTIAMGEGSRRKELTFFANEIESIRFDEGSGQGEVSDRNTAKRVSDAPQQQAQQPRVVLAGGAIQQPSRVEPQRSSPTPSTAGIKPIAWDLKVKADNTANGWTNTGWVVKKGQRIRISGDGSVSLGKGKSSTPSGDPEINDDQKLLRNVATGALIAVIGDDNNEFIYIGAEREFVASRDGALFLGLNEGFLDDNTGSYSVKVEVIPDTK
ncbi:MAG TPA: LecA/PA-IL family lectin [Pyrinomonadaceae bacterium]|jgi:hypothetical protein|nr:LecA/PA-IL family lectin [Pyrinomonadaceae bacterium]